MFAHFGVILFTFVFCHLVVSPSRLELSGGEADVRLCAFGGRDGGTTSLTKHCPFKGHLSGALQLQSLVGFCCEGFLV